MIFMRIKRFVLICVCFGIAFSLFSCAKKTTDLSGFEQMTFDSDGEQEPFADTVYLIVPENASGELVSRVEVLAKNVFDQTGVQTIVKYDAQQMAASADVLRVLIGNTSDIISAEALKGLRKDDYICRYDRGAIVLGGTSEPATIQAIERFEKELLPASSNFMFISEDAHFEYFGEYEINSLTLNGFSISDFTIAYGADGSEEEIADVLRKYILSKSGYALNVKAYGKLDHNTAKIIYLHVDNKMDRNTSLIEYKDYGFEIHAGNTYALSAAVANFAGMLIPQDTSKDVAAVINTCAPIDYQPDNSRFSLLVQTHEDGTASEFLFTFSKIIRKFDGDALCLLGSVNDVKEDIKYSAPDGYDVAFGDNSSLVCKSELVSEASLRSQEDIAIFEFLSDMNQTWTVYIADRFNEQISQCGAHGIVFLKEEASDTVNIIKIGEIPFDLRGEKYFVYVPRILAADISLETYGGEENDFYIACCNVSVDMKYHGAFLELKNTAE